MQSATALTVGQVNQATVDLANAIDYLDDEIKYLYERLHSVVVEQDEAAVKEPSATAPARSELAKLISGDAGRVRNLAERLSILRNSLDL